MNHILLFEPDRERIPHLIFLLKLADIKCTVARTIEEAINWLSADRLKVIQFDLFLLSSLEGVDLDGELLVEALKSTTFPVATIQRETSSFPELLNDKVITCHPDNLLSCLKECLAADDKRSDLRESQHPNNGMIRF